MKKLSLGLFLALAAAMLWPAAGPALGHGVSAPSRAFQRLSPAGGPRVALAQAQTLRISRSGPLALGAATGPCTVTGTVRDFYGDVLPNVEVDLYYRDGKGVTQTFGWVDTDDTGVFTFTGVPETTDGEIDVYPDASTDEGFWTWGNTFTQAGPNEVDMQPGFTGAQIVKSSQAGWNSFTSFGLETSGCAGGGLTTVDSGGGVAYVMAPDYSYAIAYPWDNQGIEWSAAAAMPVTPGANDSQTIVFRQSKAQSAYYAGVYLWGGSPGAKSGWSSGTGRRGTARASTASPSRLPGGPRPCNSTIRMVGSHLLRTVSVTIPSTATAGYTYDVHVARVDSRERPRPRDRVPGRLAEGVARVPPVWRFRAPDRRRAHTGAHGKHGRQVEVGGRLSAHDGCRAAQYLECRKQGLAQAHHPQGQRPGQIHEPPLAPGAHDLVRGALPGRQLVLRGLHVGHQGHRQVGGDSGRRRPARR